MKYLFKGVTKPRQEDVGDHRTSISVLNVIILGVGILVPNTIKPLKNGRGYTEWVGAVVTESR